MFIVVSRRGSHTRCALVTGVLTCALPICLDEQPRHSLCRPFASGCFLEGLTRAAGLSGAQNRDCGSAEDSDRKLSHRFGSGMLRSILSGQAGWNKWPPADGPLPSIGCEIRISAGPQCSSILLIEPVSPIREHVSTV